MHMKATMVMVLLAIGLTPPVAAGEVRPPKVERTYGTPMVFARDAAGFRRVGPLPAGTNLVGVPVLQATASGYVLLDVPGGPLWVDKLNLRFDSALPKVYCGPLARVVASAGDSVTHGARGVGEGCK